MSELQSWPWQPGLIWCEEEREDLGFGSKEMKGIYIDLLYCKSTLVLDFGVGV